MTRTWPGGCAAFSLILFAALAGCTSKSAEQVIPQEQVNRQNPVASDARSIAEGKRLYGATDCAMCHGIQGDGKGVLAKDTPMKTQDWRQPVALSHFTDGELFYIIENGKSRMPAYSRRESPDQAWTIVDYLRSIPVTPPDPKS